MGFLWIPRCKISSSSIWISWWMHPEAHVALGYTWRVWHSTQDSPNAPALYQGPVAWDIGNWEVASNLSMDVAGSCKIWSVAYNHPITVRDIKSIYCTAYLPSIYCLVGGHQGVIRSLLIPTYPYHFCRTCKNEETCHSTQCLGHSTQCLGRNRVSFCSFSPPFLRRFAAFPRILGLTAFAAWAMYLWKRKPTRRCTRRTPGLHQCQGLNSHYFHIIGDGHQTNSRGLYTHYKDSY